MTVLPSLALGVGCRRGVSLDELESALDKVLADNVFRRSQLGLLASCDIKRDEAGLLELAEKLGLRLQFYPISALSRVAVPQPSAVVKAKIGTASVAEAAALLAGGGRLVMKKRKFKSLTMALATVNNEHCR